MKKKINITAGGNMLSYASIMLLAGIGIPILAAMNATLGKHLNSPVAASAFAFFIDAKYSFWF